MKFLTELFLLDTRLYFKKFDLEGDLNIIKFILLLLLIFTGLKSLTYFITNYFVVQELSSLFIGFLGLFTIVTKKISYYQESLFIYFPSFGINKIKKYFLYKKLLLKYFFIIFMLFPLRFNSTTIKGFYFFLLILTCMAWIEALFFRIFSDQEIYRYINIALRIIYFILSQGYVILQSDKYFLINIVNSINLNIVIMSSIIIFLLNLITVVNPNRKETKDD